jgi:hypothetical protein
MEPPLGTLLVTLPVQQSISKEAESFLLPHQQMWWLLVSK